ncbi:MAG: NUDIX domain-containing protein [Oscillospiraceae bacterium]|nr:NUDIX domain-containing protein [Oscillospiraceae bacterium]
MEKWDLYNEDRVIIGEHIRGKKLPANSFHLVVHVWIKNNKGLYLMSQRAYNRPTFPLMWECVGGSVLKGENSINGALRETKEEVGVELSSKNGTLLFSEIRKHFNDILDVWLFTFDGSVSLKNATTDEVEQTAWMDRNEILKLKQEKKLINTLDYFFDIVDK